MTDSTHRQVFIESVGAHVDEGIALLLDYLATREVRTLYSCEQDSSRGGYILFPTAAGMETAVRLLAVLAHEAGEDALRARILDLPEARLGGRGPVWRLEVRVRTDRCGGASLAEPVFDYMLRFPSGDGALMNQMCTMAACDS